MTERTYTAADFRALAAEAAFKMYLDEPAPGREPDPSSFAARVRHALNAAAELADANLRGAAAFGAMSQRAEAAEAKLAEAERQRDALNGFRFRRNVLDLTCATPEPTIPLPPGEYPVICRDENGEPKVVGKVRA